jgi:Domain of unknown function (DUF2017)
MPQIASGPQGTLEVRLDAGEAELMRGLTKEMRTLLEADIPRTDAVISRLFPDAYETPEQSHTFRDLVGDELRQGKLNALRDVIGKLNGNEGVTFSLAEDEIDSWLTTLTDMRLAIGTRLDITEETMNQELEDGDPDSPAKSVLHWLGWLQETTITQLMEEEP